MRPMYRDAAREMERIRAEPSRATPYPWKSPARLPWDVGVAPPWWRPPTPHLPLALRGEGLEQMLATLHDRIVRGVDVAVVHHDLSSFDLDSEGLRGDDLRSHYRTSR
jgi:hypothetical protein